MKFSIKTLRYLIFAYFRIAKLAELAMKDSQKIVRDREISGIREISENSENSKNPVIQN